MFYDYETNQIPINVAFVTPSVTTYTGLNPSFRFYTLDGPYEGASMVGIDPIYGGNFCGIYGCKYNIIHSFLKIYNLVILFFL